MAKVSPAANLVSDLYAPDLPHFRSARLQANREIDVAGRRADRRRFRDRRIATTLASSVENCSDAAAADLLVRHRAFRQDSRRSRRSSSGCCHSPRRSRDSSRSRRPVDGAGPGRRCRRRRCRSWRRRRRRSWRGSAVGRRRVSGVVGVGAPAIHRACPCGIAHDERVLAAGAHVRRPDEVLAGDDRCCPSASSSSRRCRRPTRSGRSCSARRRAPASTRRDGSRRFRSTRGRLLRLALLHARHLLARRKPALARCRARCGRCRVLHEVSLVDQRPLPGDVAGRLPASNVLSKLPHAHRARHRVEVVLGDHVAVADVGVAGGAVLDPGSSVSAPVCRSMMRLSSPLRPSTFSLIDQPAAALVDLALVVVALWRRRTSEADACLRRRRCSRARRTSRLSLTVAEWT